MITLNELIRNNITNDNLSYGDLLESDKNIDNVLDPVDREVYYKIKNSDKQRILMNENHSLINENITAPMRQNMFVSGIGEATQIY